MDLNSETAHVLVVDDEGAIRYSVSKTLQRIGYEVDEAASGEDALSMVKKREYDVVLTDIKMPGITGVDLLRKIKEASPDAIVILMTGFASLGTAVESLRLGAHDYLIKPSSSQDIRASVSRGVERSRNLRRRRALLDAIRGNVFELTRADVDAVSAVFDRVEMPIPQEVRMDATPATSVMMETLTSNMTLGPLTIYPGRYQISVGDKPIDLTPTEFDLLLYLAAHRGRVVSCHELVREVRGYAVDEAEAREVIRPHVSNLRRKLKQTGDDADIIVNVRGIGYRLSETGQ
ncbi:MAG TPA: response regulator transcription factor [Aggregatilineales bacterium]|nr:response regulator transcription factor [Anaerolineae bacterium]HUN08890.1 response regulator transcription factor [Aggregatilineales bacterium]